MSALAPVRYPRASDSKKRNTRSPEHRENPMVPAAMRGDTERTFGMSRHCRKETQSLVTMLSALCGKTHVSPPIVRPSRKTHRMNRNFSGKIATIALLLAFCLSETYAAGHTMSYDDGSADSARTAAPPKTITWKDMLRSGKAIGIGLLFVLVLTIGILASVLNVGEILGQPKYGDGLNDWGTSLIVKLTIAIPCFSFAVGLLAFSVCRLYNGHHHGNSEEAFKDWRHSNTFEQENLSEKVKNFGTTTDLKNSLSIFFWFCALLAIVLMLVATGMVDQHGDIANKWDDGAVGLGSSTGGLLGMSFIGLFFIHYPRFRDTTEMTFESNWFFMKGTEVEKPVKAEEHNTSGQLTGHENSIDEEDSRDVSTNSSGTGNYFSFTQRTHPYPLNRTKSAYPSEGIRRRLMKIIAA